MTFAAWSMLNFNMFPFQGRGCASRASRGAAEVHLFQWNLRSLKLSSMNRNTCYAINQWNGGYRYSNSLRTSFFGGQELDVLKYGTGILNRPN